MDKFLVTPPTISFGKEGAEFKFNFSTKNKPIRLVLEQFEFKEGYFSKAVIYVNDVKYVFENLRSLKSFTDAIDSHVELSALLTTEWTATQVIIAAKSVECKSIKFLDRETYSVVSFPFSASEVMLYVNDIEHSRLMADEVDGIYTVDVADLLPQKLPDAPTTSGVVNGYPFSFQIKPAIAGGEEYPASDKCYSFGCKRPNYYRFGVNLSQPLVDLKDLPVLPMQQIYVHYFSGDDATYNLDFTIVNKDGSVSKGQSAPIDVKSNTAVSFVCIAPPEGIFQIQLKKGAEPLGDMLTYYVLPPTSRFRIIEIPNFAGFTESVFSLIPMTSQFEFTTDKLLLANGRTGIKNSAVEESMELQVDMLSDDNARKFAAMLATHGYFDLIEQGVKRRCIVNTKSIEALDESAEMQIVRIKYQYA